jgi:hypothetical protein
MKFDDAPCKEDSEAKGTYTGKIYHADPSSKSRSSIQIGK